MIQTTELLTAIYAGKVSAVARAVTIVENRSDDYLHLLDELYRIPKKSYVIGVTGAPGSGKSTFIDKLVRVAFEHDNKIAIVAIDPSSIFTEGAFLGDRIRFADNYPCDRVFFRSMASKWNRGSINPSLFHVTQVLNAAGFDWIIVESVGAGQNDMEIKKYVDTLVLVMVGDMGDEIQCMKAGIMEIADLFVINKIDLHNSRQLEISLMSILPSQKADGRVFLTDSLHGEGFDKIQNTLDSLHKAYPHDGKRDAGRDLQLILNSELELFWHEKQLQGKLQRLIAQGISPYQILQRLEHIWMHILENI